MSVGSVGCWLGPTTVIWADAVLPFPASVEVTALVTLFCAPAVVPTTFTANVQEAPAARLAPERLTRFEPAAAAIVPPPQLPAMLLGDATVSPEGRASVKPMPLKEIVVFGFDRLKLRDVMPFNDTLAAPKTFAIVGGKLAGGGGVPDPDEPPPQPVFQTKLSAMPRHNDTETTFPENVGSVFRSSL